MASLTFFFAVLIARLAAGIALFLAAAVVSGSASVGGLAAHRDYPMIGLDNNAAERMIRGPVVTRKNAGGSRNGDTARNAAVIWTVTATAQMAGLNLLTWLTAYLDECGRNGGKPLARPGPGPLPALERQPRRPPHLGTAAAIARINPRRTRPHRRACRTAGLRRVP